MRKRTYIGLGVVAIALAVSVFFRPAQREEPTPPAAVHNEPAATVDPPEADDNAHGRASARLPDAPPQLTESHEQPDVIVAQSNDKTFRSNASGRLVLDEHTRLNMEALFARTDRDRLADAKQQAIEPLPPAAAAQAAELLEQYDNYQQAQKQAYPPGVAPPTEEAALAELDGLHALREAHFGPVVARALYGEEEALSRQLIQQMRLEKDRNP
ncbi:MAG TPA: lipase secretion chaperone [Steroidobacteraceae bacterium]|nr:lipase secretion chaperone [Steroidobacteraceae bacterium]